MKRSRKKFRKVSGILLLDKPLHLSSNNALQRVRHLFQAEKAGHTGALDPLASGMLPICLGEATKVSAYLLDANKRYLTTATLGMTSETGDSEGGFSEARDIPDLDADSIEKYLARFRGDIKQVPPMYSALKRDGKKLYELARQGVEVEREARPVTIFDLKQVAYQKPELTLDVRCSKGTYIRTLVEDIGEAIGCGAYVSMLRRTEVDPFSDLPIYTLEQLESLFEQGGLAALDELLSPIDSALPHLPEVTLDEAQVARIRHGQRFHIKTEYAELIRMYDQSGDFIGLGQVQENLLSVKRLIAYS